MDTKGIKKSERLDLGLEAILSGDDPQRTAEVAIDLELSQTSREGSKWTLGATVQQPQSPKNEYEVLADERKWTELVLLADTRLADGDDSEVKLWWIRGHLGAFSMPVSFLSAPFDAVCRKLSPASVTDHLKVLLEETGLLVLQRLREVGDVTRFNEVRESLELLGVKEAGRGRHRVGTSSFRSLESGVAPTTESTKLEEVGGASARPVRNRLVWMLLSLLVVLILFALDRMFPHMRTPELDIASEGFENQISGIEQVTDLPSRRDPAGRLGALFYSIGEGSPANPHEPKSPAPSPVTPQGEPPRDETPKEPPPPRAKEEVNTRGPLEGAEFRERVERVRPQSFEGRREELQGGAPQAVLPRSSPRGFESEQTYRVLTRTSVLSAPSFGGRVVGQLDRGDRVLVEGKLGRWLRLRSKKGRGGYVLATDVEEVSGLDITSNP